MLRAAVAAEAAGTPSVSLVSEGFERQALATARGLGFDGIALAVLRGHPDSRSAEDLLRSVVEHTVDEVVDGLTAGSDAVGADPAPAVTEPSSLDVVLTGTVAEIGAEFAARGWSDGLPIVPPTREVVEAFVAATGHDPWRILGPARPSGRDVSVWSVAVNAVMAGCEPRHLPVLLAIAEVLVDPRYGVEHSGNTTGADALVVLSGPNISSLGFNCGQGALRDGTAANTTVGRWLRLFLRNVHGFTAEEHDKATFGNTFRVALAEDAGALAELGWPSVGEDAGFAASDDVATVVRMNSGMIVGSVVGSTPEEILGYLANGLTRVTGWELTHVFGLGRGQYRPLLVLSPVLARVFARAGWSKDDVRLELERRARIPARTFEALIGEWSNLTAGRRTLHDLVDSGDLPPEFAESDDPDRLVPIVAAPGRIEIAVAGDPNRTNAYVMSNDGPHGWWTSARIELDRSTDLECRVDGTACS